MLDHIRRYPDTMITVAAEMVHLGPSRSFMNPYMAAVPIPQLPKADIISTAI